SNPQKRNSVSSPFDRNAFCQNGTTPSHRKCEIVLGRLLRTRLVAACPPMTLDVRLPAAPFRNSQNLPHRIRNRIYETVYLVLKPGGVFALQAPIRRLPGRSRPD